MRFLYVMLGVATLLFGFTITHNWERSNGLLYKEIRSSINKSQLTAIAEHLRIYRRSTGRYPSNSEGLAAVNTLTVPREDLGDWHDPLRLCRVFQGQLLSLWGEPFVYENRQEESYYKFDGSLATETDAEAYAVRVDNDVYVWSLGAARNEEAIVRLRRTSAIARAAVVAVCLLFFGLFVYTSVKGISPDVGRGRRLTVAARRLAGGFLGGILFGLSISAILLPVFGWTCYAWSRTTLRTPKLTREYLSLISKYRDRGVISDTAYKKIVESMKKEPPHVY